MKHRILITSLMVASATAALALSGAILGVLFPFTGANMGEGPSFWNNVFSGALATGTLLLLWLLFTLATGAATSVCIERDVASGWRLGGRGRFQEHGVRHRRDRHGRHQTRRATSHKSTPRQRRDATRRGIPT